MANKIASELQWADLASRVKAKANSADLATVATSGSYNDLSNQPTIPTVNNSTITIQKNGAKVDDFTTNQATAKTINITVPTSAADVNALPDSTLYGSAIELTIDSSTFVVTATLKDQNGDTMGNAQTIDLPLESVVVSGSYDNVNKKIILTLESGSTVDIPVGDLVAGLQSEITSSNKLSSDLVDDTNHSHKFATASQLNKIDGLANIKSIGANLNLNSSTGQLSATDTTYNVFTGTDGTADGTDGLVPAPTTAVAGYYLRADGTWGNPSFTLPIASANELGGVKVGTNLTINSTTGVLSANAQVKEFTSTEWNALWA